MVGDVAGHGAAAAALTSLSRYTLRTALRLLDSPVAAVRELDAALRERPQLSLVTVCCAMLRVAEGENGVEVSAEVLLAGHPPAYLIHEGLPVPVGVPAQLLGIDAEGAWQPQRVRLAPGDLLVLYTDGVIDTLGDAGRFGEERLARTLAQASDAAGAVSLVNTALTEFARGPQGDDTAVLAVRLMELGPHELSI